MSKNEEIRTVEAVIPCKVYDLDGEGKRTRVVRIIEATCFEEAEMIATGNPLPLPQIKEKKGGTKTNPD